MKNLYLAMFCLGITSHIQSHSPMQKALAICVKNTKKKHLALAMLKKISDLQDKLSSTPEKYPLEKFSPKDAQLLHNEFVR